MEQIKFLLPEIILVILSFALLLNSIIDQDDKEITNKVILILGSIISIIILANLKEYGLYLNNTFNKEQTILPWRLFVDENDGWGNNPLAIFFNNSSW